MKHIFSLLLFFTWADLRSQNLDSVAIATFSDAVANLANSEMLRHGSLAIQIKDVQTKSKIFSLHQERSLPSASILKLVTTASVMSVLGPQYRFETKLSYTGTVRSDTLFGDIWIHGGGDPSLGSDRFADFPDQQGIFLRWAAAIKGKGIKHIKGNILVDTGFYDGLPQAESWIWGDIGNAYGAGVFSLNINENKFLAQFSPGSKVGDAVAFNGTKPSLPYMQFDNLLQTGERGSGDQSIFYSAPLGNTVQFTGTIPTGYRQFTVKGAIPNPPYFAQYGLKETLELQGIMVDQQKLVLNGSGGSLDRYVSPPLQDLCRETNYWSINLYADSFLKLFGKQFAGKSDFESSAELMRKYWTAKGADMRGFGVKDGSGLSPSGFVTVQNMTEVLSAMYKDKAFEPYYRGLAVMGQSGTVRRYGKKTRAEGNVRAKSGSFEGTRSYAGYVTTRSGQLLSFAIIVHRYLPDTEKEITKELVTLMELMANF